MEVFGSGCVRSSQEDINIGISNTKRRAKSLEALLPPETLDLRSRMMPPRNQGSQGTCVAFASTAVMEYFANKFSSGNCYFSPRWLYELRSNKTIEGMPCGEAVKILQKVGVPYEDLYPYESKENNISSSTDKKAAEWRILHGNYLNMISEVKAALVDVGPVLMAMPCFDSTADFWIQKNSSQPLQGGHAVTCVGYNVQGFILRNSWGDKWNGNGYTVISYKDWITSVWETWSFVPNPPYPLDTPNDLANPDEKTNCCKCCCVQ